MAVLTGNLGSISGTGTSYETYAYEWLWQYEKEPKNITRFGDTGKRYTTSLWDGNVRMSVWVDGGTKPPLPAGSIVSITLTQTSGKTYTGSGIVMAFSLGANAVQGDPQTCTYAIQATVNTGTDIWA